MPKTVEDPNLEGIRQAVEILRGYGVKRVVLFGSAARGERHRGSDLDLACEGIPPQIFFKALGKLLATLQDDVDLVDLTTVHESLRRRIAREGVLLYEAG